MPPEQHTSKQFDAELEHVRGLVCAMGVLVERQLSAALVSLERGDAGLAERVVLREVQVNSMELSIDELCASVIARRQPASNDLRFLTAALKAITDLERIGDEAKKIAFVARRAGARRLAPEIVQMGEMASAMLGRALSMFDQVDAGGATELVHLDLDLESLLGSAMRHLLAAMIEDPRTISGVLDVIFVAKSLERVGDHARNLSEHVVYMVTGKDVRHLSFEEIEEIIKT